jgi:hypothetical protein
MICTVRQLNQLLRGLGLVPNGKRSVSPIPAKLLALVPKPEGKNEVVKSSNADPERDTVPMLMRNVKRQKWQGAKLAQALKGSSRYETVKNIYDFIFDHIQYELDPPGSETVRSLRRLVADKKGDCDCFASAIANLLTNLNIPFAFRIAAYKGSSDYSHIYIVVPKSGNDLSNGYYTIDPVVHRFNYEVPFTTKKDFGMNLKSLDGFGDCPVKKFDPPIRKEYVASASSLKAAGLTNTAKLLTTANIPFTENKTPGEASLTVGKTIVPAFVDTKTAPALVASLIAQQNEPEKTEVAIAPTSKENKAVALVALGLFGMAAIVNQFKSKPSALNGMGAPRKKIASYQF